MPADRGGPTGRDPAADPFTLDIIAEGLTAAADEMFAVLRRTAMSPIIYEVLDVGTGLTDDAGRLVSSGAGIPTFVGVLDKAVKHILDRHGADAIGEGDVFVTNDPYAGGVTHLNDVVLAEPVFVDGACVAWAASIAHWSDIGGRTPGSLSVHATEIQQEGLRLPAVRLIEGGRPVDALIGLIEANSRMPDTALGDLWAQIAAGRRAAARVRELASRHGVAAFRAAIARAFAQAEARARAGLATLPPGRYTLEEAQDDGACWPVAVTVSADRFAVDLRDAPDQRAAPFNTSRDGAVIAAQMIFKGLCDPTREANDGSYRPLEVLTRPGSIFDPRPPAPHGYYFETRIRLYDLIWQCLARALPGRLPMGHFASICGTVLAGRHPLTGRPFTLVEPQQGGWGACDGADGLDAMFSACHGETYNCPVEVAEARYGLRVERKELGPPAPEAARRGGRGVRSVYAFDGPAALSTGFTRARVPVWGDVAGGRNTATLVRADGARQDISVASGVTVDAGDRVVIETAWGGGRS